MIDFHTHILPEIDDGSDSREQSLKMLFLNEQHGVETLVASPHFYLQETNIESFLTRREEALCHLKEEASRKGIELPRLIMGAEVLLVSALLETSGLEELCLEGTRFMLLELPYSYWTRWVFQAVHDLVYTFKIIPIIAHVDRYSWVRKDPMCLMPLLEAGALIQINAGMLIERSTRRLGLKLISHHMAHVMGSDAHGDVHRAPNLWQAEEVIRKALGDEALERMEQYGQSILSGEMPDIPEAVPIKKGFFGR